MFPRSYRIRTLLIPLALQAMAMVVPAPAWAQTEPWAEHSPVCRISERGDALDELFAGADAPVGPASPLLDEGVRDLEEFGYAAVVEGHEVENMVAFTFDDGPRFETTPRVLAALARYDVPATFFVVGWRYATDRPITEKHAGLLRDILAAGHIIGNHTFRHENLAKANLATMRQEIDDNTRALIEHVGYRPHTFRPPYGAVNKRVREHLRREGLTEVRWGIDSLDFLPGSMNKLRARTMSMLLEARGGVLLMHDTKEATAANIAGILDDLEAENCRRLDRRTQRDPALDEAGETSATSTARGDDEAPIIPVSIHYFIRERDGTPRPVPEHVRERTARYIARLPERCAARERSE